MRHHLGAAAALAFASLALSVQAAALPLPPITFLGGHVASTAVNPGGNGEASDDDPIATLPFAVSQAVASGADGSSSRLVADTSGLSAVFEHARDAQKYSQAGTAGSYQFRADAPTTYAISNHYTVEKAGSCLG